MRATLYIALFAMLVFLNFSLVPDFVSDKDYFFTTLGFAIIIIEIGAAITLATKFIKGRV